MTPALRIAAIVFSSKLEMRVIVGVFVVIALLPIIVVVSIANAGVSAISNVLAFVNPTTHLVSLFDLHGNVAKQIEVSTTWPVQGLVTLEFGLPDPPYEASHTGIDIADKTGDPITPFSAGKVIAVDAEGKTGCGKFVKVDHGNNVISFYCHMSQTNATVGQTVKPGDVIGFEGQTGDATGPHVHFEVQVYGIPVNPRTFVAGDPPKPRVQPKQLLPDKLQIKPGNLEVKLTP